MWEICRRNSFMNEEKIELWRMKYIRYWDYIFSVFTGKLVNEAEFGF